MHVMTRLPYSHETRRQPQKRTEEQQKTTPPLDTLRCQFRYRFQIENLRNHILSEIALQMKFKSIFQPDA